MMPTQEYPILVYISPGANSGPGFTYSFKQVTNDGELLEALEEGFCTGLDEVIVLLEQETLKAMPKAKKAKGAV